MNNTVPATTASASNLPKSVLEMLKRRGDAEKAQARHNCCQLHATTIPAATASAVSNLPKPVLEMLKHRGDAEKAQAWHNCHQLHATIK